MNNYNYFGLAYAWPSDFSCDKRVRFLITLHGPLFFFPLFSLSRSLSLPLFLSLSLCFLSLVNKRLSISIVPGT